MVTGEIPEELGDRNMKTTVENGKGGEIKGDFEKCLSRL